MLSIILIILHICSHYHYSNYEYNIYILIHVIWIYVIIIYWVTKETHHSIQLNDWYICTFLVDFLVTVAMLLNISLATQLLMHDDTQIWILDVQTLSRTMIPINITTYNIYDVDWHSGTGDIYYCDYNEGILR